MEKKNKKVVVNPVRAVITPYAMAKMSEDLFLTSNGYKPDRFPLINYFLYAASLEVGLKAAILSRDCSKVNKEKVKSLNHNLDKVVGLFEERCEKSLLATSEKKIVTTLNKHYQNKGLEYFTLPVLASSLTGYKDFPELEKVYEISKRINAYLVLNKYFIEANTTDGTGGGLINFY